MRSPFGVGIPPVQVRPIFGSSHGSRLSPGMFFIILTRPAVEAGVKLGFCR